VDATRRRRAQAEEYRFISPVFEFALPAGTVAGVETGRVVRIRRAALTNNPALRELPAIAASRRDIARTFAGVTLTDDQLAICRRMGTDPAAFAARLKDQQAGKPMILSSQTQRENPSGVIGQPRIIILIQGGGWFEYLVRPGWAIPGDVSAIAISGTPTLSYLEL
jgi:hypothetical protein